jgi:hypothetical protein
MFVQKYWTLPLVWLQFSSYVQRLSGQSTNPSLLTLESLQWIIKRQKILAAFFTPGAVSLIDWAVLNIMDIWLLKKQGRGPQTSAVRLPLVRAVRSHNATCRSSVQPSEVELWEKIKAKYKRPVAFIHHGVDGCFDTCKMLGAADSGCSPLHCADQLFADNNSTVQYKKRKTFWGELIRLLSPHK